jgi:thioredoxin reductase
MNAAPVNPCPADLDVIVVGGGPAGLSAALYLGRSRRRVLVVDAGRPRNAAAHSAHGVLTRDGAAPGDLLQEARRQLNAYPNVTVCQGEAVSATRRPDGFIVRLGDGRAAKARRLLLATGVRDELPPIEGLAERWANGVLHCVYCHGYEVADQPVALIAPADAAIGAVAAVLQLTRDLVLCTNGELLSPTDRAQLAERGVGVAEPKIDRVSGATPELTIRFAEGSQLSRAAIFVRTTLRLTSDLPVQLGCKLSAPHALVVGPSWETTAPCVYAAGDMAAPKDQVIVAAASGAQAAMAINGDLVREDFAGLVNGQALPSGRNVESSRQDMGIGADVATG